MQKSCNSSSAPLSLNAELIPPVYPCPPSLVSLHCMSPLNWTSCMCALRAVSRIGTLALSSRHKVCGFLLQNWLAERLSSAAPAPFACHSSVHPTDIQPSLSPWIGGLSLGRRQLFCFTWWLGQWNNPIPMTVPRQTYSALIIMR